MKNNRIYRDHIFECIDSIAGYVTVVKLRRTTRNTKCEILPSPLALHDLRL